MIYLGRGQGPANRPNEDLECSEELLTHIGTDLYLGRSHDGDLWLYGASSEPLWMIGTNEAELFGKIHKLCLDNLSIFASSEDFTPTPHPLWSKLSELCNVLQEKARQTAVTAYDNAHTLLHAILYSDEAADIRPSTLAGQQPATPAVTESPSLDSVTE